MKQHIASELTSTEDDQIYFQDFDGEAVQNILNTRKSDRSSKERSEN